MQNELTFFLESFQHTGIYLIDRKTMEVYYENATAQKYTVEDRIGRPCYLVHGNKTMCSSCPLRRPERVSHVIREDLGMTFVVHAIEMKWQGKDAYAILVQRQEELPPKSMDEAMKKRMDRALCSSVLSYCEINMRTLRSQSRFFSDPDVDHVVEGTYAEHLRKICEYYIHPEDRDQVRESLGLERLQDLSANGDGPAEFRIRYRSSGAKGSRPIVVESTVHILRDELPHYVSITTKEVTKEESIQRKLELFAEAGKEAMAIFQLNITQDKCAVSGDTHTVLGDMGLELEHCQMLERFRDCVVSHIPDGEYRAVARDLLDRKQMLERFASDEKTLKNHFPINIGQDQYIWFMLELNMAQNPLTGDVEGILYAEQIDERILQDNIIAQVINNDYDYIILMDIQNNTAKAFTNDGLYRPIQTDDAAGYVENYIRRAYVGDDMEEFVAKNKWDYVQKILEKQDKYELYFYVNEKGKGARYKKGTYSYPNGDHRYIVFSRSDNNEAIEDQKRVNMQLKQALEESARATEAKTDIFARMSHDLRTPMNAIVGMASLGADEAADEECKHYFEKINTSGNYLLGLINDILDMNRLESDKVVLNEEVVDSALFLQDALTIMQPLIDQRQIKFVMDCSERKVDYVYCDVVRTRQIYINFLSNAVKFSPPGSVVQWVCRDLEVLDGRIYYEMKFIDQGCGMSQEFLKHVFEPFEQEQNPYSGENSSTGLGLAITKNLVHRMGGDVSVESELGKGSTFTLHLNHRIAEKADLVGKTLHKDYALLQGKHVLVAEDHPLNLEIEEKLLIKQGIEVTQAKDGEMALVIFRQSPPHTFDAILMDVRMPVMNGLEATRAIRALDRADAKTVPIIAATANAFDEDRNASREAGMNAHLSKPIVPGELYQTLQNLILGQTTL